MKKCYDILGKKLSFLILDFNRPNETNACLQSIHQHISYPKEIVLLSNGGEQSYIGDLYSKGLIDKCIISKQNEGSGLGTIRLIQFCSTEYFIYLQCDNLIGRLVEDKEIEFMFENLERDDVGAIDLTGIVPNTCVFSERAFMMKTDFYNANPNHTGGGTGPFQGLNLKGSEECNLEWIQMNNKKVFSWRPYIIQDMGKYAILELPCGGILKRRCDSQQLWILKQPKSKMPCFNLLDEEWETILNGKWINGSVPEKSKSSIFYMFDPEPDPA
jgi:hypothetical protein